MRKRRYRRQEESKLPPPTTAEAVSAIHSASQRLARASTLWPRINLVSGTLARELEENDFAGRFRTAMGGPQA